MEPPNLTTFQASGGYYSSFPDNLIPHYYYLSTIGRMRGLPDQGLSFLLPMNKGRTGQLPPILLPFGYQANITVLFQTTSAPIITTFRQ